MDGNGSSDDVTETATTPIEQQRPQRADQKSRAEHAVDERANHQARQGGSMSATVDETKPEEPLPRRRAKDDRCEVPASDADSDREHDGQDAENVRVQRVEEFANWLQLNHRSERMRSF